MSTERNGNSIGQKLPSLRRGILVSTLLVISVLVAGCSHNSVRNDEMPSAIPGEHSLSEAVSRTGSSESETTAEYHFSLAQAYVADGNPDRAIEEYKLTLMYDPKSPLVHTRLAAEYVKKGMFSAALESCRQAIQLNPNYTDARLMLAGLYAAIRDYNKSISEYDEILTKNPGHEEAVIYKAQILSEKGLHRNAIETLGRFLKRNPEAALGWYHLGRSQQELKRRKDAISSFKKALALRPGFSQAGIALGMIYEEAKEVSLAEVIYQSLYDESQDLAAANRLATIYLKGERYEKAIPYLEAIQANDPEDMNVRVKLGLINMELKRFERAVVIFQGILARNPDSDRIHYYLANIYDQLNQPGAAMEELKRIAPTSRLYPDAIIHVAFLLRKDKKISEALTLLEDAVSKSPNSVSLYIFQASLEEERRDADRAIQILERGAQKFPENEKLRYYLGSLYDRQGRVDQGLSEMEAILRINSDNVDALNYIGYTWTQQGVRLNEAEKLLRRALRLKPDSGYVQDSWGWHLFVRGRTDEAIVQLEKAVKLKPNESTILEHLADAYLRSNLRQKALQRYKDAVQYADDEAIKQKIKFKLDSLQSEIVQGGKRHHAPREAERLPAGGESRF